FGERFAADAPALFGACVSGGQSRDAAELVVFNAVADQAVGGVVGIGLFCRFGFRVAATAFSRPIGRLRGAVGVLVVGVASRRAACPGWGFLGHDQPSGLVVAVAIGAQGAFFAQNLALDRVFAVEGEPGAGRGATGFLDVLQGDRVAFGAIGDLLGEAV